MRLTEDQLRSYGEQGFLLLPDYLSQTEVDLLKAEVPKLYSDKSLRKRSREGRLRHALSLWLSSRQRFSTSSPATLNCWGRRNNS